MTSDLGDFYGQGNHQVAGPGTDNHEGYAIAAFSKKNGVRSCNHAKMGKGGGTGQGDKKTVVCPLILL